MIHGEKHPGPLVGAANAHHQTPQWLQVAGGEGFSNGETDGL